MNLIKKSVKPRTPKLQRLNATKHFDYVISPDSSFSSLQSSPHARSLDLTSAPSTTTTSNSDFSSITSFRIHGSGKDEIELLCRSLGLSGTDDFGISAEAWEAARRNRSFGNVSFHDESPLVVCSTSNQDEPRVFSVDLGFREGSDQDGEDRARVSNDDETIVNSDFSIKNNSGERGIKGVRPPQLTTSRLCPSFESKGEEPGGPLKEGYHLSKKVTSKVSEDATADNNRANDRSIFPLTPPPCMSLPKLNHNRGDSIWDLVLSFGPERRKDEELNCFCGSNKTGRIRPIDLDEEDEEGIDDFKSGEMTEGCTGTSSLSTTNDDETSSTNTEAMLVVSPNGRFSRKIKSWMRGILLGHGSFGMVYEGISE